MSKILYEKREVAHASWQPFVYCVLLEQAASLRHLTVNDERKTFYFEAELAQLYTYYNPPSSWFAGLSNVR